MTWKLVHGTWNIRHVKSHSMLFFKSIMPGNYDKISKFHESGTCKHNSLVRTQRFESLCLERQSLFCKNTCLHVFATTLVVCRPDTQPSPDHGSAQWLCPSPDEHLYKEINANHTIYSIPQEICIKLSLISFVGVFCLVIISFTHILQGFLTGTGITNVPVPVEQP